MVSSIFGRLSSVSGRLQNLVLLVLSPKNGRSRRPSKLSASLAGRLRRPCEESCSENLVVVVTTWLESLVFTLEPTKPSKNGRPFFLESKILPAKSTGLSCCHNIRISKFKLGYHTAAPFMVKNVFFCWSQSVKQVVRATVTSCSKR